MNTDEELLSLRSELLRLENRLQDFQDDEDNDYDPHEYRTLQHETTYFQAMIHILKGAIGTGILAMPVAFMKIGLVHAVYVTVFIAIFIVFCLHLLLDGRYMICKRFQVPTLNYPETIRLALRVGPVYTRRFGGCAQIMLNVIIISYQIGVLSIYMIFIAEHFRMVINPYLEDHQGVDYYLFLTFMPLVLITSVPNLQMFAPLSLISYILTIFSFGGIFYNVFQNLPDITHYVDNDSQRLVNYGQYMGTTMFSLESIGIILMVENCMQNPNDLLKPCGLLNIGMIITTSMYIIIGFVGYWRFGDATEDSITLNLPKNDWLSQAVQISYGVAIYISFGLQGFPPMLFLWDNIVSRRVSERRYLLLNQYILRYCIVIIAFFLALALPFLGLFISIAGCFYVSILGIILPCVIDTCAKWPNKLGRYRVILIRNSFICIVAVSALSIGLYNNIGDIAKELVKKYSRSASG